MAKRALIGQINARFILTEGTPEQCALQPSRQVLSERQHQMGFDGKVPIRGLNKVTSAYAADLSRIAPLRLEISDVLDNGVREDDIHASVSEREVESVSTEESIDPPVPPGGYEVTAEDVDFSTRIVRHVERPKLAFADSDIENRLARARTHGFQEPCRPTLLEWRRPNPCDAAGRTQQWSCHSD